VRPASRFILLRDLNGTDNNILTQIGMVVLIGLAAKNANPHRRVRAGRRKSRWHEAGGRGRRDGARTRPHRLRPIIMTSRA